MPNVTTRPSGSPAVGDLVVLTDESAASRVEIAPARGALVTSFRVGARDVLYLDESTLVDASKSVRGGIPVLFPSPGKLDGDAYHDGGKTFVMKQHGFARTLPWSPVATSDGAVASASLSLASSPATLAQYPWAFHATLTFTLSGRTLRIASTVENDSSRDLPFGLGYHPYFAVRDKAHARLDTRATRAFDNVRKEVVPFAGFDFTAPEVDLHLLDHGSTATALHIDGGRIDVRASRQFVRWVVWTLAGREFVCVEPWTSPGNALNTGENLLEVPPGGSHEAWVEISLAA